MCQSQRFADALRQHDHEMILAALTRLVEGADHGEDYVNRYHANNEYDNMKKLHEDEISDYRRGNDDD